MIKIVINGIEKDISENMNISDILKANNIIHEKIAVELNNNIIKKTDYARTFIKNGDKLEVIGFIGGG